MSNKTTRTRVVRKKKKRRLKKRAYFILLPLIIAFLTIVSYASYLYIKADSVLNDSYEDDGREKSELRESKVDPNVDNVSVLIMGVDASDLRNNADNARTDTLMVATLNKDDKSVKLVSIPRDSYVYIPEVGYKTKINHAHAYGGTQATRDTVENLLGIPIDYYVKVNFEAFIEVVDAVDGITVDVPYELKEQNSKDKAGAIHLLPGEQQLDGEEALALARTRKMDNDIERGKRQQEIIKAVIKKAVSVNSILKIDNVIEAVGSNMTTNMTFSEMKSFISYGTKGKNLDFETLTLEGQDYQPSKTYYWQLDEVALQETQEILRKHLDLPAQNTVTDSNEATSPEETSY
ncbi:MAG: LCP family protein [Bacillota bacterium]|uniref:LCP family protein n=1 Tax=unclassified Virgibacillus TaxID=2620237 RepID=UPI000EF558D5|nr:MULTISPECIES: LCP family protein [unclassified Virgibacillus]MCC2248674.1 LCP family protein [Virgibacillus sp. AGTR]MDY7044965.1 LCP family protein [Virgibacillus sp. M23]QRZ18430.1 LCP family protein [Virgibacillus sp. AGTR]